MYTAIAIYSLHRAVPINPLLLQEFYPCREYYSAITYSLHDATSTYTRNVLVSASLLVATPTDPSRYLFLVYIARYL